MLILKKESKIVDVVADMVCNNCGKTLKQLLGDPDEYNFCGLEEVSMVCGYGSQNDGTIYTFSLCEKCVEELMKKFVIPATTKECFV